MSKFTYEDLDHLIVAAYDRVHTSEPEDTAALAAAFMVAVDAIGPVAAPNVSMAEFFEVFALIFRLLTTDEQAD